MNQPIESKRRAHPVTLIGIRIATHNVCPLTGMAWPSMDRGSAANVAMAATGAECLYTTATNGLSA